MTMSLRRHYKSWSKCHGNERLKRKAFRRLRKTDIEGADVTCLGRLFQVRAAATGKARSPTADSRVRRTFNVNDDEERRRLRVPKSAVCSSSSARYDGVVPCKVHKNSELELDPLRRSQPVQLVEERSDMVVPRRREDDVCNGFWALWKQCAVV